MTESHSVETPADVAAEFERLRPRLVGVAYAILGTVSEAEDAVQEAWIKLQGSDLAQVRDLTGWLITATSRVAVDLLRSSRTRREVYVGPWLPEPVEDSYGPADTVTLADEVSWALLLVLETLSPAERAAFVLHDVFGMPFEEVGRTLGRAPAACRKLASRAREHVEAGRPRFDVDPDEHREVVAAFGRAATAGDVQGLLELLEPDAVLTSDGGGAVHALPAPLHRATEIAEFFGALGRQLPGLTARASSVNASPALLVFQDGQISSVLVLGVRGGRIASIDAVRNPDKFHGLRRLTAGE
jgi:RNA polymerase sigma-70 factor, ECF subfamily